MYPNSNDSFSSTGSTIIKMIGFNEECNAVKQPGENEEEHIKKPIKGIFIGGIARVFSEDCLVVGINISVEDCELNLDNTPSSSLT